MISTVTPARVAESGRAGRRRFRKEQNSATRVNTNGLTRPSGALRQVVTTRHLRSLGGAVLPCRQNSASKHTADGLPSLIVFKSG